MCNRSETDIFLVGIGIFELRQMTLETRAVLRRAKKVLHLTTHHAGLLAINQNTEDLSPLYWRPDRAWDIYMAIARYVVEQGMAFQPTAFAVNGNPMFFNDICWEIARLGKQEGLRVHALPAVSSIDVLPIQLGFDIGDLGTQIYEATELVMFALPINPHLSTLILQAAEFGVSTVRCPRRTSEPFRPLVDHLLKFFPAEHPVVFLRSASAKNDPSLVLSTTVGSIEACAADIEPGMTLYVPRTHIPEVINRLPPSADDLHTILDFSEDS